MALKINSMPVVLLALALAGVLVAFGASLALPGQSLTAALGIGDNGKTVSVSEGSIIKISLDENPTTGYSWNESVSSGLKIVDSKYTASGSGLMGAGGVHEWTLKAEGKGTQQFSAIYKRPWEPVAGNETSYKLTVSVN
jgi:inhibitor of cysteine peptidase